jgi:hypothetical protein
MQEQDDEPEDYGGIASDFGGTGASGDFGGGFDSSGQDSYGPDPDVVDEDGNLTQVFQDAIAKQALGSSPLSGEYLNYAAQLAALDYGLSTDPDQLTWDNEHGKYDYSGSPIFAKTGEGMNPAFDRGSIGNFFSGPEGFNKYRGPIAEGTDAHGGFWESFLEGLVNILTLGMVDPEFSGRDASASYDKSGKMIGGIGDFSHGFGQGEQPMGVEIGMPVGSGILGLLAPEYQVDMDAGKHGLRGGILEGVAQLRDTIQPGTTKETRDLTMGSYLDVAPVDPKHLPDPNTGVIRNYEELKAGSQPAAMFSKAPAPVQGKILSPLSTKPAPAKPDPEKKSPYPDWEHEEADSMVQVAPVPRLQPQVNPSSLTEEESPKDKVMSGLLSVYDPSYVAPLSNTGYSQEFLSRYPQFAKAGGYIHKYFSGGGVEGLINQGMRQQQQAIFPRHDSLDIFGGKFDPHPPIGGKQVNKPFQPFGGMFAPRPPRGGYPKPGWDRPRPGLHSEQLAQELDPKTYFHTHEAGQVDYPHFPKRFEPPVPKRPDKPQPVWSDTPKPQSVLDTQYQNFVNQAELGPVDTTRGLTATEAAETPNQTLPAPAKPPSQEERMMNKEIDITMPTNITADIEFPEQVQGTIQNYGLGGWVRNLLPAAAGAAANYLIPGAGMWGTAGAGALTGALTGGKDRGLGAIKGAMLGVGGGGLGQAYGAYTGNAALAGLAPSAMPAAGAIGGALKSAAVPLGIGLGGAMINQVPQGQQGPIFGSPTRPLTPEERKQLAYKNLTGGEAGPVFAPPQGYSPGFTPRWTAKEGGVSPELGISDDRLREMNPDVLTNAAKNLMADPDRTEEQVTKLRNLLNRFFDLQTGHGHPNELMGGDIDPGLTPLEQAKVLGKSDEILDALESSTYKNLPENTKQSLQEYIRKKHRFEPLSIAHGGEIPEQENLRPGSFVLTADVVSDAGDGNTNAGFERLDNLFGGGLAEVENYALGGGIHGPTGGLDDLRQTTIGGKQAAAVSDGEYVLSPRAVKEVGKQALNNPQATPSQMQKAGAEQLYSFMKNIRLAKHGTPNQPKQQITTGGLRNALA